MIIRIPSLVSAEELAAIRGRIEGGAWPDGRLTAGHQFATVKSNLQLPQDDPAAREAGKQVLRALERSPIFASASLARHVYPPLFNRYETAMAFGAHIDNAVRGIPGTAHRVQPVTLVVRLTAQGADGESLVRLVGCYHNLLRRWAEL
jgi:PKHD-type hydroxylase